MVLKSHIAIFSTTNCKIRAPLVESKPKIMASQLQCTAIFGCVLWLKGFYLFIYFSLLLFSLSLSSPTFSFFFLSPFYLSLFVFSFFLSLVYPFTLFFFFFHQFFFFFLSFFLSSTFLSYFLYLSISVGLVNFGCGGD